MKKAAEVLSKLLEANSRKPRQSRDYSSVFGSWRDLVGLSLADHSRVYDVRHGSLFVEVDHNGWMQLLLLRKARVLERLRRRYPELEIRDLRVRVNPAMPADKSGTGGPPGGSAGAAAPGGREQPAGAAAAQGAPPAAGPGEATPSGEVERVVAQVSQQSLKESLRRLFLSSLERERRDG